MDTKKTEDFEKKLRRTRWLAVVAGVLHKATTWVGGSALTWATVVLMGGFASNLPIAVFAHITLLVLLIILLLALALFTCKLVTKKSLSAGSFHPLQLTYRDKRLISVNVIKFLSFLLQCALLIYSFNISASYIQRPNWNSVHRYVFSKPHVDHTAALASLQGCLQSCATSHRFTAASALQACAEFCFPVQNSTDTTTTNLQVSLFTFHSLVIATCFLGLLCNLYIFCRVAEFCCLMYSGGPKLSLMRYHDEVLSRALNIGLVDADEFDAREFMLQGVGEDLVVRNIAPLEVKSQNEDFIKYLFYYPRGVEMVMGMLASENTLLQQTAANMAGFWSLEPAMEKVGMDLLSRLGEKLGMPGKIAEGATNSFKALAIAWKDKPDSPLLKVSVSRSGGRRVAGGESMRKRSKSEAAGRGGGGTSESSHTVSKSEQGGGHGHNKSEGGDDGRESSGTVSVSGGPGGGADESISTPPECSATSRGGGGQAAADQSICTSRGGGGDGGESSSAVSNISGGQGGGGGGSDEARRALSRSRGGGGGSDEARSVLSRSRGVGGGGDSEPKWNVVQKVVDLVAYRKLPTLQVYVRALDSFFMSENVRTWLATNEREMYDSIEKKLQSIIDGGDSKRASENPSHTSVTIDSSTKARTRLLAFSALVRLCSEVEGKDLLKKVDAHLNEVTENYVIWIDEVTRYDELCLKYKHKYGDWRKPGPGSKWEVRGGVFPPPPELPLPESASPPLPELEEDPSSSAIAPLPSLP